jgi:hypothetical protein
MQIIIPEPCHENWNAMPGSNEGKGFCKSCQHTVVDLSGKTDEELLAYFKQNPFTKCARFNNTQLNREITFTQKLRTSYFRYKAKIASLLLFLFSQSIFSNCNFGKKESRQITGHVISENENVEGAMVKTYNPLIDSTKEIVITQTDRNGNFSFSEDKLCCVQLINAPLTFVVKILHLELNTQIF